jgi:hypothetical protein
MLREVNYQRVTIDTIPNFQLLNSLKCIVLNVVENAWFKS